MVACEIAGRCVLISDGEWFDQSRGWEASVLLGEGRG